MRSTLRAKDVSSMRNYAQAKAALERLPKVRNHSNMAYLSSNKDLMLEKNSDGSIDAMYHGNVCVRYYPDNTAKVSDCGWVTQSTAVFISRVLGRRCFVHKGSRLYLYVDGGDYVVDHLRIDLANDKPIDPTQEQRKVLDRDKAIALRKPYKEYFDHITQLAKFIEAREGAHERFMEALPPKARDDNMYIRLEIARGFDLIAQGDEKAKELVTNWLLAMALQPVEKKVFGRTRYNSKAEMPANVERRVRYFIGKVMSEIYVKEECWKYEDVPLGQVPGDDTI